jgi:tetratricopeptide (TPR) repeat protein
LRTTEDPPADAYILVGQAQYMLKRFDDALVNVQKGISLYKQQGAQPKEGWLNILVGIYREKNQYKKMVAPLKQLLTFYPRRSYFVSLGGVYNELGDQAKMTAVYQALYDQGLLNGESEYVTLASLNMSQDNPYKATKILEEGKRKGVIKNNRENNRLLAQAYMMSAEYEKALTPMRAAANASNDGKLSEQLGSSLVALNRWKEAEAAYKQALNKGKLASTGQTLINLGLTQFEQKKFQAARATFVRAAKIESTIKTANQWIRYVDSEVARIKELEKPIVIGTDVKPLES